jgi:hypothetical protein
VFPNLFSIAPHFLSFIAYALANVVPALGPKGKELYTSKQNLLFWETSIVSVFLGVMGQSNWLIADPTQQTKKKKKFKKKNLTF